MPVVRTRWQCAHAHICITAAGTNMDRTGGAAPPRAVHKQFVSRHRPAEERGGLQQRRAKSLSARRLRLTDRSCLSFHQLGAAAARAVTALLHWCVPNVRVRDARANGQAAGQAAKTGRDTGNTAPRGTRTNCGVSAARPRTLHTPHRAPRLDKWRGRCV